MNRKMIDYIVKNKKVFIGLEDSQRTWKVRRSGNTLYIDAGSL